MRTTINIDDQVLRSAKHRAVEQGITLARVIENALLESFASQKGQAQTNQRTRLITASGPGVKPGIDLDNGCSLLDIMNDQP